MPPADPRVLVDAVPTSSESKLSRRSLASCFVSSEVLGLLMVALRPPATRLGFLSEDAGEKYISYEEESVNIPAEDMLDVCMRCKSRGKSV